MNNQGIATLTILLIIAGVIVIGGGAWYYLDVKPPELPHITGLVVSVSEASILVAEGLEDDSFPYDTSFENLKGRAIWFSVTDKTRIINKAGGKIQLGDLEEGQRVNAWHTGVIAESYPEQATARRIEIVEKDVADSEPERYICDTNNNDRVETIAALERSWADFERNIQPRPVLGSTNQSWQTPHYYQFIGNNRVFVAFEDGHLFLATLAQFECYKEGAEGFVLVDGIVEEFPLSQSRWDSLFSQYGETGRIVNTYTKSIFRDRQIIDFDDWTEVPENVFVADADEFNDWQNLLRESNATFPDFEVLELEIRTTKNSYYVGESLYGSEYYLEYRGEPFRGVILYSKSAEGLFKTTYNKTGGIIKTGNFNDSQHLKILKAPMYSVKPDGTPNPSFECDLNYVYSMSVYSCKDIEDVLGVGNCGETVFRNFDIEEEVAKIPALKTASKTIPAICPEGEVDCCINHNFSCTTSTMSTNRCKEGYVCENNKKCIPL